MSIRRFGSNLAPLILFLATVVVPASAQTAPQKDAAEEQAQFTWHLINSAIFAVGLGYALWKFSPAFFNARTADIQKAIKDATGLKIEADFRHSEIDRKMATLPEEIKRMREQSRLEMDREHQRRLDETRRELKHIDDSLQAEIQAFREDGTRQIRQRTARLALELSERHLRERGAGENSEGLLGDFIHLVERGHN